MMGIFTPEFMHSNLFNWVILPLLIFCSRTCDVTLATLRNIFISRGIRKIVPVIGFFEVLIWLIAVSSIIKKPAQCIMLPGFCRRLLHGNTGGN